ncbi:chloride channel protein [Enterococcus florum]|uniref:Chloride channel protein n=1 Tax=Enterococcus florum TaxID=2480627 RepID=A0A4P5PAJ3_9ENTE|nr:chloride channel protein [Enterococcus florum]GCF92998.1 chloride channel protein [Enterococcus florum]
MKKFTGTFFAYSGLVGLIVGMIAALFMGFVEIGNQWLWQTVPNSLGNPSLYPLLVCILGGLSIGFFVRYFGKYPKTAAEITQEIQKKGRFDYKEATIVRTVLGSLLVLLFGASVGPEAAVIGIIASSLTYFADRLKVKPAVRKDFLEFGSGTVMGVIFMAPLYGVGSSLENERWQDLSESKIKKYVLYIFATFTGFISYLITYSFFPNQEQIFAIHRMSTSMTVPGFLLLVPVIVLGALFGKLFSFLLEKTESFNQRIKNPVPLAVAAGILLGIMGMISPVFLFSGEHSILSFTRQAATMNAFVILAFGVGKMLITMVCLACNWRGGSIFPMIFSSVAIAFAVVRVFPHSPGLLVAIFTASACGVILKKPFATACLFLLFFPVKLFLWVWAAAFLGNALFKWLPRLQELSEKQVNSKKKVQKNKPERKSRTKR